MGSIEGNNSPSVDFLLLNGKLKGRCRIHPHQCQIILCNTESELLLNDPPQKTGVPSVCGMFANLVATEFALLAEERCRWPVADYCLPPSLTIVTARGGEQPLLTPPSISPSLLETKLLIPE